jgi:ubiquitin-protein ligase
MTSGQKRALHELERLERVSSGDFELLHKPLEADGRLLATISLRMGPMDTREGGLEFMEREEFCLFIPSDFPFEYPALTVTHERFSGFPHVVWAKTLCLYQGKTQWNPADGLYGYFDRLKSWLGRAALNDMDPIEGPLEPPHHITDFSQIPFVIRCNAPVAAGESWFGLAELEKQPNRVDLVAWNDLSGPLPQNRDLALAIILPRSLPMEFPKNGADFFRELNKQNMEREGILRNLALAALFSSEGNPLHLVLGLPMRRSADGSAKLHIAVWTADADVTKLLRSVLPKESDTEELLTLRKEISDALYSIFEKMQIKWCQIFEDRSEIVVRRDAGTPAAWFSNKKVLILGCGALGSWAAEIIARVDPASIHLVDDATVKPGILSRQNFRLEDIGLKKATALANRLRSIARTCSIVDNPREAHGYISENMGQLNNFDLVLDCTASSIFQMKLERDWDNFGGRAPLCISLGVDASARSALCVIVGKNSNVGIWDGYIRLKHRFCSEERRENIAAAFYSERATEQMFQPEPGCSDPTFRGSAADILSLISNALNLALANLPANGDTVGLAFSPYQAGALEIVQFPSFEQLKAGGYRVRIAQTVFREAKAWVKQNNRLRSSDYETGGLLWGYWDDAIGVIWLFDVSGPPRDSRHDPGHFLCGVEGTSEEHSHRIGQSHGVCGFTGFWHTHPDLPSDQSQIDIFGMSTLVASVGQNQKRALMLIFGRTARKPSAGVYIYESQSSSKQGELISVGVGQSILKSPVV